MRIRTIKPQFWTHEALAGCQRITRLLAIALLNFADDDGYFLANPKIIKSLFPLEDDPWEVEESLRELVNAGYLEIHASSDNRMVGHIINFLKHQVVNKPQPSKLKPLMGAEHTRPSPNHIESTSKGFEERSGSIPGTVPEASRNIPSGNGREGNGGEQEGKGTVPSCNGGVHRYISWCPENGWTGFTPENRVQLAKAFPGIDLDLECNKSDIWLRANPAKAKKKNWYTFLTNWMDRSTPSPGNRSAEYTSGNAGEKNEGGPPHFVVQLPAPDLWQEACEATYNRPPPCDWPALSDPIQRELLSVIKEADPLTIAAWSAKKKEKGGA